MSFDLRRLRYDAERARLPAELRAAFAPLSADASTRAWIQAALANPQPRALTAVRDLAMKMVSLYDANGLVGAYSMRVLSTEQWRSVLGEAAHGRLLDVGAGDGEVTAQLAPLFDEVVTTELSAPMARRLRKRGYRCHERDAALEELPEERPFDVVAVQNVIDRTTHPLRLLERLPELGQLALFEVAETKADKEQQRQMRLDHAFLQERLESLEQELETEPAAIEALYEVRMIRVSPVGMVISWPESMV